MADIPVFPAGNVGIPMPGPASFPVENLDPSLYSRGFQAGEHMPTATTAITSGLEEGTQFAQQTQHNDLVNQDLQQQQQLAPLRTQILQTHAETERLKAQAENQQVLASSKRLNQKLSAQAGINSIFSGIYSGDVAGGIDQLEKNTPSLIDAGIDMSNDDKGQKVVFDQSILASVRDLPRVAQATGDPRLAQRAQSIVDKFQNAANDQISAGAGKPIRLSANANAAPQQRTPEQDAVEGLAQHESTIQNGGSQPNLDIGASGAQPQPAQTGQVQPAADQGNAELFPAEAQASAQPSATPTPEHKAYIDRILESDDSQAQEKEVARLSQNIAAQMGSNFRDLAPKDQINIRKQALAEFDKNKWKPQEQREADGLRSSSVQLSHVLDRAQADFDVIENYRKAGSYTDTGPGTTIGQLVSNISGNLGEDDKRKINGAYEDLSKVSYLLGLKEFKEGASAGSRIAARELDKLQDLYFTRDKSYDRNRQALEILKAKSAMLGDSSHILNAYSRLNRGYAAAQEAVNEYQGAFPGTKMGEIDNEPALVVDPNRPDASEWLDRRLHLPELYQKTIDGRATAAPQASPTALPNFISNQVQRISAGEVKPQDITPSGKDIPDSQTKVSPGTILRQQMAESNFNPRAESHDENGNVVARGIAQFTDKTGKAIWNQLKLSGDYDPYDPKKATLMQTALMNNLLDKYGGNTRLALAAYNAGPKNVSDAIDQARKIYGDDSWHAVSQVIEHHTDSNGKPYPKKMITETLPYVKKIMEDDDKTPVITPDTKEAFDSLKTAQGQQNAKNVLSPAGVQELQTSHAAKTIADTARTPVGNFLRDLISPINTAEAAEPAPEGGKAGAENLANTEQAVEGSNPSIFRIGMKTLQDPLSAAGLTTGAKRNPIGTPPGITAPTSDNTAPPTDGGDPGGGFFSEANPIMRAFKSLGEAENSVAQGAAQGVKEGFAPYRADFQRGLDQIHLPPGLESFALGSARTGLLGLDDEMGAALRSMVLGEDWDTALKNSRAIRLQHQQQNPKLYTAGEVGGVAAQIANAGVNIAKAAGAKGAAFATGEEAGGQVAKRSVAGAVGQGAKTGAAYGAAQGFNEGEGGFANRAESAATGGIVGAGLGAGIGGTLSAAGKALDTPAAQAVIQKVRKAIGLGGETPELNPGEKALEKVISGTPTEKLQEASDSLANPASSPRATIFSEVGESNAKQAVDKLAKMGDATVGNKLQETAGETLEGRNQDISDMFDQFAKKSDRSSAYQRVAETVDKQVKAVETTRRNIADAKYGTARSASPVAPITSNDAVKEGLASGQVPPTTPVFDLAKGGLKDVLTDPIIAKEVEAAQNGEAGLFGAKPKNAFDVLQEAKSNLADRMENGVGSEKTRAKDAWNKLRDSMRASNPEYAKADDAYRAASDALDEAQPKIVKDLRKFLDADRSTSISGLGAKIFNMDDAALSNFMNARGFGGKIAMRRAARAHIEGILSDQGERQAGESQGFPAQILKKGMPDKLRIIFGQANGDKIVEALQQQKRISGQANTALSIGAQTAGRLQAAETGGLPDVAARVVQSGGNITHAALRFAGDTVRQLFGGDKLTNVASQAADIMKDPVRGKQLLDKLIEKEKLASNDTIAQTARQARQYFEQFITPGAEAGAAQIVSSRSEDFKPQTAQMKRQLKARSRQAQASSARE